MKWIAIKDQLPPVDKEVYLHSYGFVEKGEYCGDHNWWSNTFKEFLHGVVHWAEITPPEMGETK